MDNLHAVGFGPRGISLVDIKKRSGEVQEFERNKLKTSVKKAGANEYDAERVTSNIEKRITKDTNTSQIREWVYIELRSIPSRIAAENYNSYKKQRMTSSVQQ